MTQDELLVCPFCGTAPRFIDDTGYGDCQIFCPNEYNGCPAPSVQSSTKEPDRAIAAWNRRPSSDHDAIRRAAVAECCALTYELYRNAVGGREAKALLYVYRALQALSPPPLERKKE